MWFWQSSTCCPCHRLTVAELLLACFLTHWRSRWPDWKPYGIMILLTLLLLLPMLGAQMGVDFNILSRLIGGPTEAIIRAILRLTGNG